MERKIFWLTFTVLGVGADFILPMWWALAATIPIFAVSWWIAYRSDWFQAQPASPCASVPWTFSAEDVGKRLTVTHECFGLPHTCCFPK